MTDSFAEIERLVDVLMASVELDGFHSEEEDTPAECRAALLAAIRALASPAQGEATCAECGDIYANTRHLDESRSDHHPFRRAPAPITQGGES